VARRVLVAGVKRGHQRRGERNVRARETLVRLLKLCDGVALLLIQPDETLESQRRH